MHGLSAHKIGYYQMVVAANKYGSLQSTVMLLGETLLVDGGGLFPSLFKHYRKNKK